MFCGDLILARRKTSLLHLPLIGAIEPECDEYGEEGGLRITDRRPDGWQVVEVGYGLPDDRDWLGVLVAGTRGPVMVASVFHSRLCGIRGLAPGDEEPWSVRLHAESRNAVPNPGDGFPAEPPAWMISDGLLTGPEAVDAIAAWSAAAGVEPDRSELEAVLADKSEYFIEELFYRLLDAAGLGSSVEYYEDDGSYHCLAEAWRDPAKLEASIAAMKPGVWRGLWCIEHQNCFAKVGMLPDGTYELEYCDGSPEERYRAAASSLDQVLAAMLDWAASEVAWRDGFEWSRVERAEQD